MQSESILAVMLKKALEYYTRGFALWVILLGLAAYHAPDVFKAINDFHVAKLLPQPWIRGCHLGFLAYLTANRLFFAVTMSSNVMSYVAKADTAYAVSLTTVSTLICPIVTPGLTKLLAGSVLPVAFWPMLLDVMVMVMVIVPLWAGFLVRRWLGQSLDAILPVFPALSVTLITFICALVIALNKEKLSQVTGVGHQKPIARSLWPRYDASRQLAARRKTGRCCWR